jgi:hypothetical protein
MKKKIRPLGEILLELEKLTLEMVEDHDLQWGDILNLQRGYLEVHCPGAQEQYIGGGSPEFYYGPRRQQGEDS